jgi:TolB-like protein/Flp pilus assembly protein TadD
VSGMEKVIESPEGSRDRGSPFLPRPESTAAIQEELGRILSSSTFRAAEREKTFLRYVVNQTTQGRGAEIKEYTIAVEAFGRRDSFDPRSDSIVRTEARNVRLRLARYYASEGLNDPVRIELPKRGYEPQFTETNTEASRPAQETPTPFTVAPDAAIPVGHSRKSRLLAFAGFAILILAGFGWFGYDRYLNRPAPTDAASVAVLPFVDLSAGRDTDAEILGDGLTEEVIESLARIPRLHVVARSSVFLYKGRAFDIRTIGRELNVRNVLEGTVRIVNGHVRISARLEDATNGYQLWSEEFDQKLDDAVVVRGQISTAIAQSLGVQLTGAANLKSGAPPSPVAYRDFLRGLYFLHRSTAENVRTSINYFQRAVATDPSFAPAYRGLANGYSRIALFTSTPSLEMIPQMRAAASKAIELDDTLGEAHLDLARAYGYEGSWTEAEREYRRALELSPSSATVHHHYGYYLLQTGRLEEALAESRIALELDPVSPGVNQFAGRMLYFLRRYDDAIALLRKALVSNPSLGILHQTLGLAYLARPSSCGQGLAESERARELMERDPMTTGQLAYAYAISGRKGEARDLLGELEKGSRGSVRALAVARIYVGLGDRDQAFSWLGKAVDQRDVALLLQADPVYDGLRSDPRFSVLLQRVHLSPVGSPAVSVR